MTLSVFNLGRPATGYQMFMTIFAPGFYHQLVWNYLQEVGGERGRRLNGVVETQPSWRGNEGRDKERSITQR